MKMTLGMWITSTLVLITLGFTLYYVIPAKLHPAQATIYDMKTIAYWLCTDAITFGFLFLSIKPLPPYMAIFNGILGGVMVLVGLLFFTALFSGVLEIKKKETKKIITVETSVSTFLFQHLKYTLCTS